MTPEKQAEEFLADPDTDHKACSVIEDLLMELKETQDNLKIAMRGLRAHNKNCYCEDEKMKKIKEQTELVLKDLTEF